MSVSIYRVGYRHGLANKPRMGHRKNGRPYDSVMNQRAYDDGYSTGKKVTRWSKGG